ncbi:toll/interleukin-1 receptor domain-containing protein [Bradyrhizobium guangzhouense]|nr:toll/interleukin-1 receptor domain-containing protein [Bradyrhizobium guangzhouense]
MALAVSARAQDVQDGNWNRQAHHNSAVCAANETSRVACRPSKTLLDIKIEVPADRVRLLYLDHHEPLLNLAQEKRQEGRSGDYGPREGGAGGGGGLPPEIIPALLILLAASLAVSEGLKLRDYLKKPPVAAAKDADVVECSVFGPHAARPGDQIMISAFLHPPKRRKRARFLAKAMDLSATLRGRCSEIAIMRGATVTISLSVNTLYVDEPAQSMVWQGLPVSCEFVVTIPNKTDGQSFFAAVRVSVEGRLVGRVKFKIMSDRNADGQDRVSLGDLSRYRMPFISYATSDRKEVLKRVQILQIMKTKLFMDMLSLDPGDRWEKKLYEHISRCDLFLLFWSQAARDSHWVIREAEYALERQRSGANNDIEIVPVILEQGVSPPANLSHLNFNDPIFYLILGTKGAEAPKS